MSHHASSPQNHESSRWLALIAILVTLVSFVLGLSAYRQGGQTWGDAVFRTLQLFHLHFYDLHEAALHSSHPLHLKEGLAHIPWELNVARFGAGIVALGLIPAMLAIKLFRGDLRKFMAKNRWSGHIIVCGHCSRAVSLIKELAAKNAQGRKHKVVLIGHCPVPVAELPSAVLYLEGNAQDGRLLYDAGVQRAASLVALNEDDRANLEILVAAARECEAHRTSREPLECHAHMQDSHLKSGLHNRMSVDFAGHGKVHIRLFNYYELVARSLACQHPMPESVVETTPLAEHYVIVGFGAFGQNVALKLVKMGQQLVHDIHDADKPWKVVKPKVTAIDMRGNYAADAFLRAHPSFTDQCDWRLIPHSCESSGFLDLEFLSDADAKAKTSVIFCLENEAVSLRTALLLRDICRADEKKGKDVDSIYLRLSRPDRLGQVVANLAKSPGKPHLHFFASDAVIFSSNSILHQQLDLLAAYIHTLYLQVAGQDIRPENLPAAASQQWSQLSEENRESNRDAADHIWAKLRTLGYALMHAPAGQKNPPKPSATLLKELTDREEELARAEHCRWITSKVLAGWKYGPKTTTQAELAKGMPKFHSDIKDYDDLAESTKEKDRVNIRAIPALLREGRLIATRYKIAASEQV